jgi:hypothetical protein
MALGGVVRNDLLHAFVGRTNRQAGRRRLALGRPSPARPAICSASARVMSPMMAMTMFDAR